MTARALIARVLVERRRVLLPLGIAALVEPRRVRAGRLSAVAEGRGIGAPRDRRAQQLAAAERDEKTTRASLSRAEQADADLQRFYRETLPTSIEGARRMSYAKLASLADHHGLVVERRSYDRDSGYRGRLHKLKINMALSGEYPGHPRVPPRARDLARVHRHRRRVAQPGREPGRAAVAGRAVGDVLRRSAGWRLSTRRQLGILAGLLALLLVVLVYNRDSDPVERHDGSARARRRRPTRASQAVDVEVVRLDALTRARPEPQAGTRNPFRFRPAAAAARRRPPPAAAQRRRGGPGDAGGPAVPVGPPPPPPIALKFIGVVEQAPSRLKLAVLSDGRNVFYGKEGEVIEGRYRIERIGVESIEMAYVDGRGRQTLRLSGS